MENSLEKAVAVLEAQWGEGHWDGDSRYVIQISDKGDEADDELCYVRDLVAPFGCTADWTGNCETRGDGTSTSEFCIYAVDGND